MINQGDQYLLPITIKRNDTYITPTDVDDVFIQVGTYLKAYSKQELTFNSSTNEWNFPLTQKMTYEFDSVLVPIQIGLKVGTSIYHSAVVNENVGESIIKKEW